MRPSAAKRIVAITDDTKAAKSLRSIWDMQRDVELAAHPWSFAMTRVQLPALASAPEAVQWAIAGIIGSVAGTITERIETVHLSVNKAGIEIESDGEKLP